MPYNKVILLGNLTRDADLRFTPKGTKIAQLGLACNRVWKTEEGEKKEEVLFIDVTAFGRQAETIAEYFRKGDPILVEGRLKLEQWTDKETGKPRQKILVVLEGFSFVNGRKDRDGAAGAAKPTAAAGAIPGAGAPAPVPPPEEDDVPF
jgi:single-strand DNA-binding protein